MPEFMNNTYLEGTTLGKNEGKRRRRRRSAGTLCDYHVPKLYILNTTDALDAIWDHSTSPSCSSGSAHCACCWRDSVPSPPCPRGSLQAARPQQLQSVWFWVVQAPCRNAACAPQFVKSSAGAYQRTVLTKGMSQHCSALANCPHAMRLLSAHAHLGCLPRQCSPLSPHWASPLCLAARGTCGRGGGHPHSGPRSGPRPHPPHCSSTVSRIIQLGDACCTPQEVEITCNTYRWSCWAAVAAQGALGVKVSCTPRKAPCPGSPQQQCLQLLLDPKLASTLHKGFCGISST